VYHQQQVSLLEQLSQQMLSNLKTRLMTMLMLVYISTLTICKLPRWSTLFPVFLSLNIFSILSIFVGFSWVAPVLAHFGIVLQK
jgi:hypothetical protein